MGASYSKNCVAIERDTAAALAEAARINTKIDILLAITLVCFLVLFFTTHAQRVAVLISAGASIATFITAIGARARQISAVAQMAVVSAVAGAIDVRQHCEAGIVGLGTAVKDTAIRAAAANGFGAAYLKVFGSEVGVGKNLGGLQKAGGVGDLAVSKVPEHEVVDESAEESAKDNEYVAL